MSWEQEWSAVAVGIDMWTAAAERYMQGFTWLAEQWKLDGTAFVLVAQAHALRERVEKLVLPAGLKKMVDQTIADLRPVWNTTDGPQGVACQMIAMSAIRVPLEHEARASEEPRRLRVEQAFVHLNRLLVVDDDLRAKWSSAFARREEHCERLGGTHLLWHGVYGFKVDANTGITDLVLGEHVTATDEVRAASALVLTEWKLVHGADGAAEAAEGLKQAKRYATVELTGMQLKRTRYVVLVSTRPIALPADETDGDLRYRFINVAIDRKAPSVEART